MGISSTPTTSLRGFTCREPQHHDPKFGYRLTKFRLRIDVPRLCATAVCTWSSLCRLSLRVVNLDSFPSHDPDPPRVTPVQYRSWFPLFLPPSGNPFHKSQGFSFPVPTDTTLCTLVSLIVYPSSDLSSHSSTDSPEGTCPYFLSSSLSLKYLLWCPSVTPYSSVYSQYRVQ